MTSEGLPARLLAWEWLHAVAGERYSLHEVMEKSDAKGMMPEADRQFCHALVLACLRWQGALDHCLRPYVQRWPTGKEARLVHLLRLGAAQLLLLHTPVHAALHTSVALAKRNGFLRQAGMVNAVLRRIQEHQGRHEAYLASAQAAVDAWPAWLMHRWSAHYGHEEAQAMAALLLQPAPLDITVKENPQEWAERLNGSLLPTGSVRLTSAGAVTALEGYADGAWWVQDAAAALPARLLGEAKGKAVLDLCAAPGGKTAQLAAAGARVIAVEKDPQRSVRLRENLSRLRLDVEVVTADALLYTAPAFIDAILLDAPCSATGILRRHSDVAWHRKGEEIVRLAEIQQALLTHAARRLSSGGRIVYCTCSLEPEEGERVVEQVLNAMPGLQRVSVAGRLPGIDPAWVTPLGELRVLPDRWAALGGIDGFYAALLEKA